MYKRQAVTVVGAAQLANSGIKDSTDLTKVAPGLKMNEYTPSAVVFNIRGVSQNDFGDEQEPPVAVYQDDSYASSFVSAGGGKSPKRRRAQQKRADGGREAGHHGHAGIPCEGPETLSPRFGGPLNKIVI